MISSKSDYTMERPYGNVPALDRNVLQIFIGKRLSEMEADRLLHRIADHKWYVGERLDRDVGYYVAAIDYIENFYRPLSSQRGGSEIAAFLRKATRAVGSAVKTYLIAKGNTIPI